MRKEAAIPLFAALLTAGNKVRLTGGGDFVCTISARKGTGHWICVVLSGREWDN